MGDKRQPRSPFGAPHRHYASTDSTNTRARELAAAGAPGGTVVTAAEQTAGRGRQGRTWTAPPEGALLYSALLRPLRDDDAMLPLAAPLAVCEAAEALAPGTRCGVKWPNDVHLDGRKLAGVLIEARPQDGWAVIGVGLNLAISPDEFPAELRNTATSLSGAVPYPDQIGIRNSATGDTGGLAAPGGATLTPGTAAAVLSERLGRWVDASPAEVLAAWRERDVLRGREISWETGSGVADGVDERGYLLVVSPDGNRIALGAGEVHLTVT